jgi:hypothetical protein
MLPDAPDRARTPREDQPGRVPGAGTNRTSRRHPESPMRHQHPVLSREAKHRMQEFLNRKKG